MKYIIAIAIILMALSVQGNASPWLVSDSQPSATSYQIIGAPDWLPKPVVANGTMRIDLGTYYEGTWALKVKACNGLFCSPETDYILTCPAPLKAPVLTIEP